jgi:DnaA N-terminal domain
MRQLGYLEQLSRGGGRRANGDPATATYRIPFPITTSDGTLTSAPDGTLTSAPDGTLTSAPAPPKPIEKNNLKKTSTSCSIYSARAKSRLDEDDLLAWAPKEADCAIACERGYNATWIADQIERFRDHHLAKGSTFQDIDPAWRNWLRGAFDRDDDPPDIPRLRGGAEDTDGSAVRLARLLGEAGQRLLSVVGENAMRHWFKDVRCDGVQDGVLQLTAPNRFIRDRLRREFEAQIKACWDVEHVEIRAEELKSNVVASPL